MVCLETTFLIDLLRGKEQIASLKDELDETEKIIAIASPSVMELWFGAMNARLPLREKEKVNELCAALTILPFGDREAKEAAEIEYDLNQRGLPIGKADIMIAAIARSQGHKLVTRDADYTHIPGLMVLKY